MRIGEQLKRYSRQVILSPIGEEGQRRLLESRIAVVGLGALGSVTANNLVRAGVGEIILIDRDFVDLVNLQRQCLFDEEDARNKLPKAIALAQKLKKVNSGISLKPIVEDLNSSNAHSLLSDSDLVLDGTDNLQTRFLINQICVEKKIPWIYTACLGSSGILMNIYPEGPCLQCLIPFFPPPGSLETCETAGILNSVPTLIGAIQSAEAMKILIGNSQVMRTVFTVDLWTGEFTKNEIKPRSQCPICQKREFPVLENTPVTAFTTLCGRQAFQIIPERPMTLRLSELNQRLTKVGQTIYNQYLLGFRIDDYDLTIFADGRAIIKGTQDENIARSLYAKYIGH
ncbi:MAG: ThiF family adenylyltransferase [Candidatus Edwardsbacteria bacterium]